MSQFNYIPGYSHPYYQDCCPNHHNRPCLWCQFTYGYPNIANTGPETLAQFMLLSQNSAGGTHRRGRHNDLSPVTLQYDNPDPSYTDSSGLQPTSSFGQQYGSSYNAQTPTDSSRTTQIRATHLSLQVPDIGDHASRVDRNKLHYLPRILHDIDLRFRETGQWCSIRTPNIPVSELLDDFIPFTPGYARNRTVYRISRVNGVDQPVIVQDMNTLVASLKQQEGGDSLRLEFRDR